MACRFSSPKASAVDKAEFACCNISRGWTSASDETRKGQCAARAEFLGEVDDASPRRRIDNGAGEAEARNLVCEGGSVGVADEGDRGGEHRLEDFFASERRVGVDVGEDVGGTVSRRSTRRRPSRRRMATASTLSPGFRLVVDRNLRRSQGAPPAHVQRRKTSQVLNLSDRRAENVRC